MWVEVKLMESYTDRAWCIVLYCSVALKCLARFSALPAAAVLPGTDAMVYPVLRSLMLSHSMVCSGSLAARFTYWYIRGSISSNLLDTRNLSWNSF